MTSKPKKTKRRKGRARHGKVLKLRAPVEDGLLLLAEEDGAQRRAGTVHTSGGSRCAVDIEVVDSFQSKGPGYQDANQPDLEKSHDRG